ncbi:Retrovirus-related Pol polyprotein from transposon 297 [Eumeta japonica]|uniref:Retrovirus-related Pol polyprotein from transposon 297 n=1 Tax=Eumeta variegata TaxID=151549 RepID=A0A4C1WQR1_EUMVA|nr:Retrovirus-related Pol polyprotein from transposon 297 [Eumeta japonica]
MEKLRFTFAVLAASDGKTNLICITSIETPDGCVYDVPDEKNANKHTGITSLEVYAKIKNSLKKRHQTRKIWIPLTDQLRKIYLDAGENVQFDDQYLDEITQDTKSSNNNSKLDPEHKNFVKIADKFLLEKFSGRTSNVNQWIEEFETECERFEILQDESKIEILKHLLDKQCLDWYTGWSQVKYAYTFRYQTGSLLEYATKKERLLLEDQYLNITQKQEETSTDKRLIYKNSSKEEENQNEIAINFNEHIKEEDFKINMNNLNAQQETEINNLIDEYKSCFAKDKYDVGKIKNYEARIDLLVDKYCSKRPYRCSIEEKKEIEKQVGNLLQRNLIEESYSPFSAPVTLAFKKEDQKKTRLCIDFRELNKIILPQAQPFPLIDDLVVKTRNCKYFSTLDINSAFWSIPLRIEDKKKTGFVTQEGHFQWTCLPFGLKTSPAIFQRILSNILRKHKLTEFTINYIDDILVFSKTYNEHINHLKQLLEAIKSEGFRLKFTKCTFAANSVKSLVI